MTGLIHTLCTDVLTLVVYFLDISIIGIIKQNMNTYCLVCRKININ